MHLKSLSMMAALLAVGMSALGVSACSDMPGAGLKEAVPLLSGPPPQTIVSPYEGALHCLAANLTPDERSASFSVLSFPDRTGKVSIGQGSDGTLSTQGGIDRLMTALQATGVRVVPTDPLFRNFLDWEMNEAKAQMLGTGDWYTLTNQGKVVGRTKIMPDTLGRVIPDDYVIMGSIDTADPIPGGGMSAFISGIGGGYNSYRMVIGMDGRVIGMPVNGRQGPVVVAADHLDQQFVAYNVNGGVASFFNGPAYTEVTIGHDGREALQLGEGVALDRMAFDLVSKTFKITACDFMRDFEEQHEIAPR